MFPVEKAAVLNNVAMGMTGRSSLERGLSFMNLLDEQTLNRITLNTWDKAWGSFLKFGSASAGVLGLFLIARMIKFVSDTIIHGYALYSFYG